MRAVNSTLWMRCKNENSKTCSLVNCPNKYGLNEQRCQASTYVLEKINGPDNSSTIREKDWVILRPSINSSSFIHCKGKSVCKYSSNECGMPGPFEIHSCKYNFLTVQQQKANSTYPVATFHFLDDDKTVWLGCNHERKMKCKRFSCNNNQPCTPDRFELIQVL